MHDACISGTCRALTVAPLQRLKMEALIPAPDDFEVRYLIKFLNAQSIAPIEIHRHLCQQSVPQISRSLLYKTVTESPLFRKLCVRWVPKQLTPEYKAKHSQLWSIFLTTSRNYCPINISVFRMTEPEINSTVVPISGGRLLRHRIQKLVPRHDKCLNSGGEYVEK